MTPLALVLFQVVSAAPAAVEVKRPVTDKWTKVVLSELKKASFASKGSIKVPPGTKVEASKATSGADSYGMVTLTLPTGQHVLLIERSAKAPKESKGLRELFAQMGQRVKLERQGPTWFVLGTVQGGAFALQGESWGAAPGLSCGVKETVDEATFEVVTAICASLAPAP